MKKQIKPKTQVIFLLLSIFVIMVSVSNVSASPLPASSLVYVSTNGSDANNGTAEAPYLTILKGVNSVSEDGTVYIANGVYSGINNTNITLSKSMNITGKSQKGTIINGTGTNWIFNIPSGLIVTIQNITLTNTNNVEGGAIYNDGTLTLINCTFTNNTATNDGGAVWNGGIINNLTNSIFANNKAELYGGAIENAGTINKISNCKFTNNTAGWYGGAMDIGGPIGDVTDCLFTENTAGYGGSAIDNYAASFNVTDCIFTGITASYYGGYIDNWYAGSTIITHFNSFINTGSINTLFCYDHAFINATDNWWGTNNPDFDSLVVGDYGGSFDTSNWLYMNITSDSNNIFSSDHTNVTVNFNNAYNGTTTTSLNPKNGHIPDGTIVNYSSTLGSFNPTTATTVNGIATSLFTANQTGIGNLTATTDNQTVKQLLTVNPASYLYLNITSSKNNPTVGETFIITYKLGNNGPDNATNVIINIPLPKDFEITNVRGNGNWTYNLTNNIITWTLTNVTVGDPYLYITGRTSTSGVYVFGSNITSETYDLNTKGVTPITVTSSNPITPVNPTNPTIVTTKTKLTADTTTIPMQHTGLPIGGLILAILTVLGGSIMSRKK